jgi:hypothetical protein
LWPCLTAPEIFTDVEGMLTSNGPPLESRYVQELIAGLHNKRLGDYTGYRRVQCTDGTNRLAGLYPGLKVPEHEDGPADHLVWDGDPPQPPSADSKEEECRISVQRLARHLVTRLESSVQPYCCDWTLAMHLFCTVQMQKTHEVMRPPSQETLDLLRQVCTSTGSGIAFERPELIEQAVRSLLDLYPEKLDLVSHETLKSRFSLGEPRVVRIKLRRLRKTGLLSTLLFMRLCSFFAYLLRKHEVLRHHPTLPMELDKIADRLPFALLDRHVGTVLGSIPLHRPTTRRYEYIQAATTLLTHELVDPENTRCTTYSAPILLEAIRCLSECFAFPFPSDIIEELGRYYEIMHDSNQVTGASAENQHSPIPHEENGKSAEPAAIQRVRIPRRNRQT